MNSSVGGDIEPDVKTSRVDQIIAKSGPEANSDDLISRALHFLSTASNETLGGIAIGLAACTYLVLGRIGLLLLGGLGGVLLHATWERQADPRGRISGVRRENGIDLVNRILDTRKVRNQSLSNSGLNRHDKAAEETTFENFQPETSAALMEFADAVIQDYVEWWYHPILPGEAHFPSACHRTLAKFVASISQHLAKKRPADFFLDFLTNASSIVIVFLGELSNALNATTAPDMTLTECVYGYLADNPNSSLQTVLDVEQQTKKLRVVADDILQNFLENSSFECGPARTFLREILAGIILEMTLKSCSTPEWINGWIVYLLEEGEPDISQAIDAGMDISGLAPDIAASETKARAQKEKEETSHRRRVSKAEEAMEEAMEEAKRLSQLIADDDAKKLGSPLSSGVNHRPVAPGVLLDDRESGLARRTGLRESSTTGLQSPNQNLESKATKMPTDSTPFTSFDRIIPQTVPTALQSDSATILKKGTALTLYNANVSIHDDSTLGEKGKTRNKPTGDYLIQIEPISSQHPGWVIVRKYTDFETLHEVLRRIAQISGVISFTEQHSNLPSWKEHSKPSLRGELERYLRDACWFQPLAESEGMKRFLDKDQGQMSVPTSKTVGSVWQTPSALENVGKGVLDVLTHAPKGAAEGGKVVLGGVTGVFGSIAGPKKLNDSSGNISTHQASRSSTFVPLKVDNVNSSGGFRKSRVSEDSMRGMPLTQSQLVQKHAPMERQPSQPSLFSETGSERESKGSASARSSLSGRRSATHSRESSQAPSKKGTPLSSPTQAQDEVGNTVPPLPMRNGDEIRTHPDSPMPGLHVNLPASANGTTNATKTVAKEPSKKAHLPTPKRPPAPLTEEETRVAVELLFAVVNELYTLSSAWNIRRTLLNAAKTFLLRPGNPSLSSIRTLIQDSIIAANTSDAGIAGHIRKIRGTTLPTKAELQAWPAEMSMNEKEKLRIKARKLLVERGLPTALTGVMGQAATGEAMGRVFDCLQMEEMSRGLIFGLLLQGVRAITH